MHLLRVPLVVALVYLSLAACARPSPPPGALRIHGVPGQGTLLVDGVDRGPVQAVQLYEGLAPGVHVLELRRDGTPVFLERCVVRSGMVLDVRVETIRIEAPIPVVTQAASPRAVNHARPIVEPPDAPVPLPASEPPLETAPPAREPSARPAVRSASSAPAARATPRRTQQEDLDTLLQRALEADAEALPIRDARRAAERDVAAPVLSETPSRADVERVMAEIAPSIHACMRHGDSVTIELAVSGSTGRPTNARIGGVLAGTPAGSCIARASRRATFPRFSRATFTVRMPFRR